MTKRLISFFLAAVLVLCLTACGGKQDCNVTMEQVIDVYTDEGYIVWSETYESPEDGCVGVVQANLVNEDFICFTFFDSDENAKAYYESIYDPVSAFFYSVLHADSDPQRVQIWGNICIEYFTDSLYEPFQSLTSNEDST